MRHHGGVLAGDADRDRAANVLRDAFAEGRLTPEEYEERIGRAYQARTYQELDVITADVPRPMPPPQPFPPYPPPAPRTNPKAIGSLVVSLLGSGFCGVGSLVSVVLGHLAMREIRDKGERGDGLATAGLVIGYLGLAGWILLYVLGFSEG